MQRIKKASGFYKANRENNRVNWGKLAHFFSSASKMKAKLKVSVFFFKFQEETLLPILLGKKFSAVLQSHFFIESSKNVGRVGSLKILGENTVLRDIR